jgi:integrase
MATEKVGIYRRWLSPVPLDNGKPIPKAQWPEKRRYSWTVRWFGTNGKRYSNDFTTKKLAEKYARNLQSQIEIGKQDRPERITLQEFTEEHANLMKGQVAYATLVDQLRALRFFQKFIGGSITLQEIKARHAEGYIAQRSESGLAVGTVNKDIRTLRRIFTLAIEPRGYLSEGNNPFAKIKQRKKTPKSIRYVPVEEYRLLLDAVNSLWWRAFIAVAHGCGLRRGEILNLTWTDIDFENQQIYVRAKDSTERTIEWEPKDHEAREVPMSDETTQLLANLQAESKEGLSYVFVSPERFERIIQRIKVGRWNSKSETINNMNKNFGKICLKAGVRKCTIHDLRRSAITNWARYLPIQVVQQLAGHSNITTTRCYYLTVRSEDFASASKVMNMILENVKSD